MKFRKKFFSLIFFGGLVSFISLAHEGHLRLGKNLPATEIQKEAYEKINQEYLKSVKPVFNSKCMDCHSTQTKYPIYYKMPFIKGIIDKDISESRKHLDMTNDFPFKGHASVKEDLEAIKKQVSENKMPPFRYKIMHPGSGLSEQDKKTVFRWIDDSINLLKVLPTTSPQRVNQ